MSLRRLIRGILNEAIKDDHYTERLYDRFINASTLEVGYEIPGSIGQYEIVGSYQLPASVRAQILENAQLVENYNFPKNKSFGIQIAQNMIDKHAVNFYSEELKKNAQGKTLVFVDEKTQSNGNIVYAIVRDNIIKTIYFAKSYVPQDASKLRVDAIIKSMDALKQRKVRQ